MSLNDDLITDASTFLTPGEFAEAVTYRQWTGGNSAGKQQYTDTVIYAIVDRQDPAKLPETTSNLTDVLMVSIHNHPTLGVTNVNERQDKIKVASTYGGTATDKLVTFIESNDAGMWVLKLRG
jgi:hypothetical protein